jgi:hypothetical protein
MFDIAFLAPGFEARISGESRETDPWIPLRVRTVLVAVSE